MPTDTPTPEFDYVGTIRQLTPCENAGKHHIFAYVRDPNGAGIPGIKMKVHWDGGEAILTTGTKIEDSGLADFAMFKGTYSVEIQGGTSEIASGITPDYGVNEACGENAVANSLFHISFEVIFQRTY